jgi:hypothetical protein
MKRAAMILTLALVALPALAAPPLSECTDRDGATGKEQDRFVDTTESNEQWLADFAKHDPKIWCDSKTGSCTVGAECHALSDRARTWHLLTKSEGGTVTLLKDLTQKECEEAKWDLLPKRAPNVSYMIMPSDINTAECFK